MALLVKQPLLQAEAPAWQDHRVAEQAGSLRKPPLGPTDAVTTAGVWQEEDNHSKLALSSALEGN